MKFGYVSRPEWPDLEEVMAKLRTETDLDQDVPVIVWKRAAPGRRNVPPLAIMRAEDAIRLLTMKRWLDEQYPSDKLPPFRLDSE
jgi:hypothetical protein